LPKATFKPFRSDRCADSPNRIKIQPRFKEGTQLKTLNSRHLLLQQ
jgi:hypothetical protein